MGVSVLIRRKRARGLHGPAPQRRWSFGLAFMVVAAMASATTQCTGGTVTQQRIDLKVLVLNDGSTPGVAAIRDELRSEGVPVKEINLADPARPVISAAFLSTTTGTNPIVERAYYQGVVVPNEATAQLSVAERDALAAFQAKFGIREVVASTWANPAVGLNYAANPGYMGSLDNMTATVTAAGLADPFKYLTGSVPFDVGSYGFLATPLATLPAGETFTPLVTMPIPGSTAVAPVLGVYAHGGTEDLIITTSLSTYQQHFQLLGRGIVSWLTKGVHLGFDRSYFTVHVDDMFAADERWNAEYNCTPGEDCPAGVPDLADIRMTAADLQAVVAWQNANRFRFELGFNGFGSVDYTAENGSDPLLTAAKANKASFNWLNHTYRHQFLGCLQDFTTIPWTCQRDAAGNIRYLDRASIEREIVDNRSWATYHGLPFNRNELLTGEHSGLFILPQQPVDNPNLAAALYYTGITVTGSDASRDFNQRHVQGSTYTRTVPRYPLSVFFNTGTKAELIDEYNWIFTSAADGGSGICSANPATMTCLPPISSTTGFEDWILPFDTAQSLRHIMGNDPRPHYAHQSNLAEDRLLLSLTDSVLSTYRSRFASNTPLVTLRQTQASDVLAMQTAWATSANQVEAYTVGKDLYVVMNGYQGKVPITAPTGTRVDSSIGPLFGEAYAGEQSAWATAPLLGPIHLVLP
jgi:hypothetical protein